MTRLAVWAALAVATFGFVLIVSAVAQLDVQYPLFAVAMVSLYAIVSHATRRRPAVRRG